MSLVYVLPINYMSASIITELKQTHKNLGGKSIETKRSTLCNNYEDLGLK